MSITSFRRAGAIAATVAAALLSQSSPRASQAPRERRDDSRPRLVVLLVVDQMRADYVERFQADWTGGLKRLVSEGARFTNAAYPYLTTFTCAGHATIATGAFPYVHGIFQNTWFDRELGDNIPCTRDNTAKAITYSGKGRDDGPGLLYVPTFADEMRAQRGARIVSMSLKARSAIMLAGRGGDAVTWMTESGDGWQTSDWYTKREVPEVKAYLDAHPLDADYGAIWDRLLPASRYREADDAEGEAPPEGWTRTFPHALVGRAGKPDQRFRDLWQRSPFADAYLGAMAAALSDAFHLGRRDTTDVLAVSFSSPDLVGHPFGPSSQEVRDEYARLDQTIGALLTQLDGQVGRGQYVVALTADHGVSDMPEQGGKPSGSTGRIAAVEIRAAVEKAAGEILGSGQYVARVNSTDVYFRPGVYARLVERAGAVDRVIQTLEGQPGIARVLRGDLLPGQTTASDRLVRAAALSYAPGRSGDLLVLPKPGWIFYSAGTTHGTLNETDQRVPLILAGRGVKPGTYTEPATPADVAPTLAALVGISMPRTDGRPLAKALRRPPAMHK